MSNSKNDFDIACGRGRLNYHPKKSQYEAIYKLINPITRKPYTYIQINDTLLQRQKEYPLLNSLIEPWLKELHPKVLEHPHTVYALYCKGPDKATAKRNLEKKHYAKLESLAKLLFRPIYCQNLKYGDLTISDFVFYQKASLFVKELPDARKRMLGSLENTIMPVIGEYRLKDFDASRQEKALRTINRNLRKEGAKLSRCGYVKRAYLGLLQGIESSGWTGCTPGMRLVHIIGSAREANPQILKSVRVSHLDVDQRRAFFELLHQGRHLYELFMVSLIYSGLAPSEIAAARYGDFDVLVLSNNCHCYTLLITQRVRKLHQRFSTLSATNQDYPIEKLRKIVLPPWAGEILNRRLSQIRACGIEDSQIREMRLSSMVPSDAIVGPDEIASRLNALLHAAGIKDTAVIRTDKKGYSYSDTIRADVGLLQRDARYLAQYCGANQAMMHATFGDAWTSTDEQSYLDLLSDAYAVTRYLHLRRYNPFPSNSWPELADNSLSGFPDAPATYHVKITNETDDAVTLTLSSDYAIKAYWEVF